RQTSAPHDDMGSELGSNDVVRPSFLACRRMRGKDGRRAVCRKKEVMCRWLCPGKAFMSRSAWRNSEIAPSTVTNARSERVLSEIVTPVWAVGTVRTFLVETPALRSDSRQKRPNSSSPTLLKKLTGCRSRAAPHAKIA